MLGAVAPWCELGGRGPAEGPGVGDRRGAGVGLTLVSGVRAFGFVLIVVYVVDGDVVSGVRAFVFVLIVVYVVDGDVVSGVRPLFSS